jgi:hypothetical protein
MCWWQLQVSLSFGRLFAEVGVPDDTGQEIIPAVRDDAGELTVGSVWPRKTGRSRWTGPVVQVPLASDRQVPSLYCLVLWEVSGPVFPFPVLLLVVVVGKQNDKHVTMSFLNLIPSERAKPEFSFRNPSERRDYLI